jgi:ASC-1-like (ASCH) protein
MLSEIKNLIKQVYKCSIHEVPCFEPYMTFIEEGKKTIEGRVGTPYYTKIRSGSILCLHNRIKEIWCEVMRTRAYPTFKDMLEKEGLKNMLPQAKSIEEGVKIYRKFPTFAEKENKFGAYAIEVNFINLEELKKKANIVTSK